ncbi:Fimbrial protein [Burkholderia sp. 8Y]|uniref:fimbrial protein n=1 Tax=Burkholderia sp. 8Y TaxID=2653133 RepID=UPI0012EFCF85|nr:fimbrial protein [Burkholderia sp. 8Y]VXB20652.1 Fimbrial protein [Burkholderia sp. 8Y]
MKNMDRLAARLLRWMLCWIAALAFVPSSAWATASCTVNYSSFTLTLPPSVAVARDLPNGSILTAWSLSPSKNDYWTCIVTGQVYTGTDFETAGVTTGGATVYTANYQGVDFEVYPTNVPGVGIAMGGYVIPNSLPAGPRTFSKLGRQWNNNGTIYNGGQLIVALVKIGDITPGTATGMVAQAFSWQTLTPPPAGDVPSAGVINFYITPVVITVLTCQTPDVTVPMGIQGPADLPSIGPAPSKVSSFNLSLNNCPGGTVVSGTSAGQIHSIQYRIDPSSGLIAGYSNVAALSGSPTAAGVGIQLYDNTGAVFPYSTYMTLNGFDSMNGGNYTIPMQARYYRTGTLSAGPANSTMTMTVLYQ